MLALLFKIGEGRFALDARRVKEVVPRVRLQQLASSPSWHVGVFVYRGHVVPVLDLHRLLGAGDCPPHLSSRIILVADPAGLEGRYLGLLATQVADLCEVNAGSPTLAHLTDSARPDPGPVVADKEGILRLLDLDRLLPEVVRKQLMALPEGGQP